MIGRGNLGRRLAKAVRRRDRRETIARRKAASAKELARIRRERRIARLNERRARVKVLRKKGHRLLVLRGPHASFDYWMLSVVLGSCVALPAFVGLAFLHVGVALAAVLSTLAVWLTVALSPIHIAVTDQGHFEARRPLIPWREVGHWGELEFEFRNTSGSERGVFHQCEIRSRSWKLWQVRGLTHADKQRIEAFVTNVNEPPPRAPHEGGYRVAS